MNWNVYFEIFGKKLKVKVEANSKEEAENYVKSRLNIIKTEPVAWTDEDAMNFFFGKNR